MLMTGIDIKWGWNRKIGDKNIELTNVKLIAKSCGQFTEQSSAYILIWIRVRVQKRARGFNFIDVRAHVRGVYWFFARVRVHVRRTLPREDSILWTGEICLTVCSIQFRLYEP